MTLYFALEIHRPAQNFLNSNISTPAIKKNIYFNTGHSETSGTVAQFTFACFWPLFNFRKSDYSIFHILNVSALLLTLWGVGGLS
jgi:hypothetical protein